MLVKGAGEFVVAAGNRLAQSEAVFGLECEAPAWLVQAVEGDGLVCHLEGATRILASEPRATNSL